MREIRIRQLPLEEAKRILEDELNRAFMSGETVVQVLHGIGTGALKKMTLDIVREYDFVQLSSLGSLHPNPGVTILEILAPSPSQLRRIRGKS